MVKQLIKKLIYNVFALKKRFRTMRKRRSASLSRGAASNISGPQRGMFYTMRIFINRIKKLPRKRLMAYSAAALAVLALPITALSLNGAKSPANAASLTPAPSQSDVIDVGAYAAAFTPIPIAPPEPTPTPMPSPTPFLIYKGMNAPEVPQIQERLMELGYMDNDEPTDYYGPATREAVMLFQRKHKLTVDGYMGEETYNLLMSDSATKYSVSEGTEGTDVKELQIRLRELGYLDAATGYFGTDTTAAVKKFQERNGLSADGTIGALTREALYSDSVKANAISYGENSEEVKTYQKRLKALGYLTTEPDGNFGKDTVAAVKLFQELNGLIADGYVGPQTKAQLMSSDAQANAMTIGMSGETVERVQKLLKQLGYLSSVDGYYGAKTEAAVRAFQTRNNLKADGKVGKNTMSVLTSGKAKAAGSSGGSSGSSGSVSPSPVPATASVDRFIEVAKSKLGSRYVRGGKGPNTFDCSGFVYYCLNQAGVKQGYMTSAAWHKVTKYQKIRSLSDVQRGDVIVFSGHVGIALGNGQMIDASSSQGKIRITNLSTPYWQRVFYCAFRIF